ncbi:MAG: hypothetical protein WBQ78_08075 [Gammaproteobacteria bacterium]
MRKLLNHKRYQISPLQSVQKTDGEIIQLWSTPDALVLKELSRVRAGVLPILSACTHVKGQGGLKATMSGGAGGHSLAIALYSTQM